jgi:ABC-type methionine transport system ATPase subunit
MSLLAFRGVSKRFLDGGEQITVLDRVSFEIEAGETVGLFASRRSGKTTLLRVAAGLISPDEGSVLWDDAEIARTGVDEAALARREGGIGYVPGYWQTSRSASVIEYVATPLHTGPPTMIEAGKRAMSALELVDATHLSNRRTCDLGVSERQLVGLARAVVLKPRLILVDEPAVLRNPDRARGFYELLRSLPAKIGCALLIASEEIAPLRGCRPMMKLSDGRLISTATRRKVIEFPTGGSRAEQNAS